MQDTQTSHSFRTGVALAGLAAVGFSSKAIFVKLAYGHGVDALTLMMLRLGLALPLLVAIRWRRARDEMPLSRRDWSWLLVLGILGYYLSSLLDFLGLQTVSASLERLILFLYPTLTVLFSALLARTPVTRRMLAALALTYAGIVCVLAPDLASARAHWGGVLLVFASTVTYALYLTWSPAVIRQVGAMRFAEWALTISALVMLLHFAGTRPLGALDLAWPVWAYGAALALFATVLPIYALAAAMARIGAGRSAMIGSMGPVLTIVLGGWVLDERLSAQQWVGAAIVMAGVWLVGKRR